MEMAFDALEAPVFRVAARDTPMPFNDKLETAVIPSRDGIVSAIRAVMRRPQS
jgi:pyruvate/2-oxoglutarate/acetoin dehydrogenase E1 component